MLQIVVPDSVWPGWYRKFRWGAVGVMAHSLQCDQRWLVLVRVGRRKFGYRTHGDATPDLMIWKDAGWHWPWQNRPVSGRY